MTARKKGLIRIVGAALLLVAAWVSPKYIPQRNTNGAVLLVWGIIPFAVALAFVGLGEIASGRPLKELEEWWRRVAWYYRIPSGLLVGVSALVVMEMALIELLGRFFYVER
jgi:hypothetical protein